MFDYRQLKALFIDIDDTIVRFKPGVSTSSLLKVLQTAGVTLSGLEPDEASRRISSIQDELPWWHWSDFIVALDLNPKQFWAYALEVEREYLQPTGPEMYGALQKIKKAGHLLYVTSNNPSSGILHKLSLAGLGTIQGAPLFDQLLGASELQAMKWEAGYWKKALAHTGLDACEVAVVGDSAVDDCEVPQSIGIPHTFLINRHENFSNQDNESVTHVMDFDQIAQCLGNSVYVRTHQLNGTGVH